MANGGGSPSKVQQRRDAADDRKDAQAKKERPVGKAKDRRQAPKGK